MEEKETSYYIKLDDIHQQIRRESYSTLFLSIIILLTITTLIFGGIVSEADTEEVRQIGATMLKYTGFSLVIAIMMAIGLSSDKVHKNQTPVYTKTQFQPPKYTEEEVWEVALADKFY